MNIRKRRQKTNNTNKPSCSNCVVCIKGSEFCSLTENNNEAKLNRRKSCQNKKAKND